MADSTKDRTCLFRFNCFRLRGYISCYAEASLRRGVKKYTVENSASIFRWQIVYTLSFEPRDWLT